MPTSCAECCTVTLLVSIRGCTVPQGAVQHHPRMPCLAARNTAWLNFSTAAAAD